jgi:hypothetical protein
MSEFKISIGKALFWLISKNCEIETNFIFFYEAELVKVRVFDRPFVKLI